MREKSPANVRAVSAKDRRKLASLIHFEPYVHRHLDWRAPLDWIGYEPYLVLEQNGEFLATLACPPDPPDVAWIRLFAISALIEDTEAWAQLWPAAHKLLTERPGIHVAAIPLQGWFRTLIEETNFSRRYDVIMFSWDRTQAPARRPATSYSIRPMSLDDLPEVERVDWAAFDSLWRNSRDALEVAFRQAAVATVAESDGQIVGYQISTAAALGGHLARLAVLPAQQGNGIGYGLVQDVLSQFVRRGNTHVTVNTQAHNAASVALYRKTGFVQTGEIYPVYELEPYLSTPPAHE